MHLLYLIFGNHYHNYLQAYASISSFKTNCKELKTINIITDHPVWFEAIKSDINIIPLSAEQLREWKGEHNYFWRAKIKAIETLSKTYKNEPIVYLDTDTFLYNDKSKIADTLSQNKALMHLNEGAIKNDSSKTVKKMHRQITVLSGSPVENLADYDMWNAGVVASPNTKDSQEFELALSVCDFLCENKVTDRLLEQFSLSVALKHTYGLEESSDCIAHYWSNKEEWNQYWNELFLSNIFRGSDLTQFVSEFDKQGFSKMPPILKISKNTKKRLIKWVEKKFPDKEVVYLKG